MARVRRRWLIAGVLALLVLLSALVLLRGQVGAASRVDEARSTWAAQGIAGYRLALTRNSSGTICQQEIEARDEQVARIVSNNCGQPASWTVTRLLDWVAELERTPSRCFPGRSFCPCQAFPRTSVRYDTQLGYPAEIQYEWAMGPNWSNPDYWRSLTDRSFAGCNRQGFGGPLLVNVRLSPEP